jgi:hypothetical protein
VPQSLISYDLLSYTRLNNRGTLVSSSLKEKFSIVTIYLFIYHFFGEHVTSPVKDPPVFKIGSFDSNCTFIATF